MCYVLVFIASSMAYESPSSTSKELEAKLRREYPVASSAWDALTRDFVAKGRFLFHWNNGKTTVINELTVAAKGDNKLFTHDHVIEKSPSKPDLVQESIVSCLTNDYKFLLNKNNNEGKFVYIINEYKKPDKDKIDSYNYWYDMYVMNATKFFGFSFLDRLQHPSFKLKSIKNMTIANENIIRIEYEVSMPYTYEIGHIDLIPEKNWAIKGVDMRSDIIDNKNNYPPAFFTENVEYRNVGNGQIFPVHLESFVKGIKPSIYEHAVVDFDQVDLGGTPETIFHLSAYGLPDIPLRPQPRTSIFSFRNPALWLTLASTIACFAGLLWLSRSRRVKTT